MSRLAMALSVRRRSRAEDEDSSNELKSLGGMDRVVRTSALSFPRALLGVTLLLALSLLMAAYYRYGLQAMVHVNSSHLTISEVMEATYYDYIPVTGYVVPRSTVYLDAVVGGQVTSVHVEEGALVQAGQPLVTLKNTNLQLEVIGREAQLAEQVNSLSMTQLSFEQNRLRARLDLIQVDHRIDQIKRQLQRYRKLRSSGGITQEQIEELEAEHLFQQKTKEALRDSQEVDEGFQTNQMKHLGASINNMERNIAIARSNLDDLILRAPIDGQVTVLDAYLGESKAQGERIGQIDEVNSFKISALVDEFYISRINVGQSAQVTVNGSELKLVIDKVYPNIKNRQFEIDLVFDSPPETLRRGQTMHLNLEIGEPSTSLTVENGPFYDGSGGRWVFVLAESGRMAERREVELGRRNPDRVEILSGLRKGEKIITSSVTSFNSAERLIIDDN